MTADYIGLYKWVSAELLTKLPEGLHYHSREHTLDVLGVCEEYIVRENLTEEEALILRTAALLHDAGFVKAFTDHEMHGVSIAHEILPLFGYSDVQIHEIQNLILATKVPQEPHSRLEEILCDADLDYLGRDDFQPIGDKLFEELKFRGVLQTRREWDELQVRFLKGHQFHTPFAKNEREPEKQQHLQSLLDRLGMS